MSAAPFDPADHRDAVERLLDLRGAEGIEVVVAASASGLTRYAGSAIIQNIGRREVRVGVRVALDDRVASAGTNQLDAQHLEDAAARAMEAARVAPPDPDFPGLPDPSEVGTAVPVDRSDADTAAAGPSERAEAVGRIVRAAGGVSVAGVYETSAHSYWIVSSAGIDCFDAYTRCVVTCLADNGEATGWAEAAGPSRSEIDVEGTGQRAVGKAEAGRGAADVEPGEYEVVLEASAAAALVDYLSYMGFGAKQVTEGESFFSTRRGESVAAPAISITDDVFDAGSVGIGFDLEGVPKKKVSVIEHGVAVQPVTDLRWGKKLGVEITGHHSGSNEFGPWASNVVLSPGGSSMDELIAGVDDGLLVTRFHYVNVLDRPKTLLTGMTRDGLFRIREGEVTVPVHNLRFTQAVLEALHAVQDVGSEAGTFVPDYSPFGSTVAPPLRIGAFNFTSRTSH